MAKRQIVHDDVSTGAGIPCCPDIQNRPACNTLDFTYRLNRPVRIEDNRNVTVEVSIKVRFEVCRGDLTLGKLAYSTTLFPGERVRLFTLDRRNRFSYDMESQLSYRQEQSYEEQFYLSSISESMSDVSVTNSGKSTSESQGSVNSKASTTGVFESIFSGAGGKVSGSYDAASVQTFLSELNAHAESSHYRSEQATHSVNSVSIGEVNQRLHTEGESEDHFESSSRTFRNENRCHAVSYFFYQINQEQTVRYQIVTISRRVVESAANTEVSARPRRISNKVDVIPNGILATNSNRLKVEQTAQQSRLVRLQSEPGLVATDSFQPLLFAADFGTVPLTATQKQQALTQVDDELIELGLIDKTTRQVSDETKMEFGFERKTQLPTGGMYVQSCLDPCDVCEPSLKRKIDLELEHQSLQNQLLQKQIELLEKSQEYRCCPTGESDMETE